MADNEQSVRKTGLDPETQLFVRDIVYEAMEHSAQQRKIDIVAALELHMAKCPLRDLTQEMRTKMDHFAPGTVLERVTGLEDREKSRMKWIVGAVTAAFVAFLDAMIRRLTKT